MKSWPPLKSMAKLLLTLMEQDFTNVSGSFSCPGTLLGLERMEGQKNVLPIFQLKIWVFLYIILHDLLLHAVPSSLSHKSA